MINEELEEEIKRLQSYINTIKHGYKIGMDEAIDYAHKASDTLCEIIEILGLEHD